ncbi:hypothetical protein Pint_08816 [Pistacia integerrima]|uniref:Uncharacterized protein n=1 Tax=Pistacia integerrima TaxID=434235 RepID=A0ACC0XWM0_9ROSI|nr:hypothetical protein Pint_08816 [Pistacia integerrima]
MSMVPLQRPPITITSDSSSSQPNPQYVEWQLQDQRLLSLLFSSLTEEAMAEVLGLTTARDVWLALENSFSHISKTRELRIKDDLQLIKCGTRSVTEYSRSFKALCDQLTAMGCSVDDTDKVHWYLRGLGTDFANFSTAQMSLTPLPTFKDLVPKAESFEIFQNSSKSRRSRGGHNGGHGHGRGQRGSYTPRCQICKIEGHTADRCRRRYDRTEPTAQLAEAFTAACSLPNDSESDWFTDTGASAHMTPDPSQLDKVEPYHGKDCVVVGNGASLPITHTGTLSPSPNFQLLDVLVVPQSSNRNGSGKSAASLANIGFSNFFEPCALAPSSSPTTSSPTTTQVPSPPCHFCADDPVVEPLQVSSSTESTSPSAAVLPTPASATDQDPPAASMEPIHATTSSAPSASHPMITRAKSGIFKPRHPAHLSFVQSSPLIHALLATSEPKGFKSAAKNPAWLAAMDDEMKALQSLGFFFYGVNISISCSFAYTCICYGPGSSCSFYGTDSCHHFISSFCLSSYDYTCKIWNFQATTSCSS